MAYKKMNIKNIKAQGLSLNAVVLAALALFVLVVLIIIFGGKAKLVSDFYGDCEKAGGVVLPESESCPEDKPIRAMFLEKNDEKDNEKEDDDETNEEEKRKCCIPLIP